MYLFISLLLGSMVLKSHQLVLSDCGDTYRSPGRLFILTLYYHTLYYLNSSRLVSSCLREVSKKIFFCILYIVICILLLIWKIVQPYLKHLRCHLLKIRILVCICFVYLSYLSSSLFRSSYFTHDTQMQGK
jgi:quinol-cytochrome oxidoreductase complex cytochrome b subunit